MNKYLPLSLLLLSLAFNAEAVQPLIGHEMEGSEMLVCSIPTPRKGDHLGDTFCVVIDTDARMTCTYNFNTDQTKCWRGTEHI